jgi:hypothetical protein
MDSGYIELAELNQRLMSVDSMNFRMALLRVENNWTVHTLILEDVPIQEDGKETVFDSDYGSVHFVGGVIGGDTAIKWLFDRRGEVSPPGKIGPVRTFTLPPL